MEKELETLRSRYERYLGISNVIFQAESSKKITKITIWAVFFSFISFTMGILGIERIEALISQFGLSTIISKLIEFFSPTLVLIALILFLAQE